MTQTEPRGVCAAHSLSAMRLAAPCLGDQPSPQPWGDAAWQYHSADAAVGKSEMAVTANSDKAIVRMSFSPQLLGMITRE
jgi:hypothetical protein